MTFFHYVEWNNAAKTADQAMVLISYYDYLSPETDGFDSVPFKEWVSSKNRVPSNDSEFQDFLIERAEAGSDTAACALTAHFLKMAYLGQRLQYAEMGKNTRNAKARQWCERQLLAGSTICPTAGLWKRNSEIRHPTLRPLWSNPSGGYASVAAIWKRVLERRLRVGSVNSSTRKAAFNVTFG